MVSLSMPMERSMESIMGSMAFMFLPSSSDINSPVSSASVDAVWPPSVPGVTGSMAVSLGAQAAAHSITAIITAKSFFIVSSLTKTKDEGDTFILHYSTLSGGSVLIIR